MPPETLQAASVDPGMSPSHFKRSSREAFGHATGLVGKKTPHRAEAMGCGPLI